MLLVAIAIKLDSRGPVFFKQRRHGFNNELIEVYKFRSLYTDMTDHAVQKSVTKDDPRVTRVGRFIRKTSIDELPQLINVVFKGNLSLVGPRPHAVNQKIENRQFDEAVDGYFARHRVKPGITGWAQINGWRGELDIAREDQAARRARPLLHRELVAAVRSHDPGEDAAGAAQIRKRLLMIARPPSRRHRPASLVRRFRAGIRAFPPSGCAALLLWLTGASGAIVFIEPSPYEVMSFLTLAMFVIGGLTLSPVLMPLVVLLVLINIGYSISGWTVSSTTSGVRHVAGHVVVSGDNRGVFCSDARRPTPRSGSMPSTRGCVIGGVIASLAAIIGYFRVFPSLNELLLLYDRARGTFKDPNVLGAFLIFPTLLALQPVMSGNAPSGGQGLRMLLGLLVPAILLSFSRAAWGQVVYTAVLMLALTFITTRSPSHRLRIVLHEHRRCRRPGRLYRARCCRSTSSPTCSSSAPACEQELRSRRAGPLRALCARRHPRARQADRHRPAAIQQVFPRRHPQLVPERLHVGRLAGRRLLSGAGGR